jgi:4-aminobutyrate aminotransferase
MECLEYLSHIFSHLIDPEEVAAIIIEPVLGEGGYIPSPDGFLQRLRRLCNEYGIMLILDEVQTGFGRTGKWFASEHYGIVPDIMAVAKAIASGMPLGAVVSTKPIMDMWPRGAHGTTFGGNPLSCAAAIATITVLKGDGLIEKAAHLGRMSLERLKTLKDRYEYIGDVRGRGLMIGVEFVKADKSPDSDLAMKVMKKCAERGLILIECGGNKNILRFIPPLIVEEAEISRALDIFEDVLKEC